LRESALRRGQGSTGGEAGRSVLREGDAGGMCHWKRIGGKEFLLMGVLGAAERGEGYRKTGIWGGRL